MKIQIFNCFQRETNNYLSTNKQILNNTNATGKTVQALNNTTEKQMKQVKGRRVFV